MCERTVTRRCRVETETPGLTTLYPTRPDAHAAPSCMQPVAKPSMFAWPTTKIDTRSLGFFRPERHLLHSGRPQTRVGLPPGKRVCDTGLFALFIVLALCPSSPATLARRIRNLQVRTDAVVLGVDKRFRAQDGRVAVPRRLLWSLAERAAGSVGRGARGAVHAVLITGCETSMATEFDWEHNSKI